MGRIWSATGLLLCLLIPWNHGYPSPFQGSNNNEDDDDEIDSDEQEFNRLTQVLVDRLGLKNMTNEEIAEKASHFLTQYIDKVGTETPLKIPNASNHTIIITIVPNSNGSSSANQVFNSLGIQMVESKPVVMPNTPPRAVPEKESTPVPPTSTTTPLPTSTSPHPTPFLPQGNKGVDNIEDAILEALSFVQGQVPSNVAGPGANPVANKGQSYPAGVVTPSPASNSNSFPLSAPFPISPLSPQNTGAVYQEATTVPNYPYNYVQNTAPSTSVQQQTNTPLIFVALPPQAASTERHRQRPSGPNPLFLAAEVFGSIADADLGGALENTFKLAETPVVQDTARLAAVGILHNVFQGFNCQFLGNCNRAPIKIIVP